MTKQVITDRRTLTNIILSLTFSRLIINITRRFPYAFLPTIARQFGVPLSAAQNVMAVQAGVGAASPLFGSLSERYGRKRVIIAMLILLVAASILGVILPTFSIFAIVMIVYGISKMIFDPAVQAYIGDRVSYKRRGMAMGFVEFSWAGALLISAPLTGVLLSLSVLQVPDNFLDSSFGFIPTFTWQPTGIQAVFLALTVLGILASIIVWQFVPADAPAKNAPLNIITPMDTLRLMRGNPAAVGAILSAFLLSTANEIFFINYGVWMESSFNLALTALGTVTIVIAAAEIGGEVSVIGLSDRFGKPPMALSGGIGSTHCYILLPTLNFSLVAALIILFIMFLFVEIGIVAAIPLFSEIMPEARAVMMSGVMGAAAGGRLTGALLGSIIYELSGNFFIIGIVSTVIGATSVFMLWRYVPES
ncbi:MAG: MFS transporter [Aggregatilineales bacterium]